MPLQAVIQRIVSGQRLSEMEAADAARLVMSGSATASQIAGLLVALRMRGETVDEITGFVRAMRAGAASISLSCDDAVDTCGTGGDGAGTFNVSTVAAFVAAGAGARIAKHGNRASQSRCGSADVLAALGVNIEMSPEASARCVETLGIGFLFAPQYHPGARHAAPARRELGIRTIFNTIGPLVHPAGVTRQVLGIYDPRLARVVAEVLQRLGAKHCLVLHSDDGLDEISISAATRGTEVRDGALRDFVITPEEIGVTRGRLEELRGGDAVHNAALARAILDGRQLGAPREIVLANAGAAIYVGGKAESIAEGVRMARAALDDGRALQKLEALIAAG